MVLRGSDNQVQISLLFWDKARELADAYGWDPVGTLPPFGHDLSRWDGSYDLPAGQSVTCSDAALLAAALERAHSLAPDYDVLGPYLLVGEVFKTQAMGLPVDHTCFDLPVGVLQGLDPEDLFSGPRRAVLEDLVDLGYGGGFFVRPA